MSAEIQLDLFDISLDRAPALAEAYNQAYAEAFNTVQDRDPLVQRDYMDAWIIGAHNALEAHHEKMWTFPEPLLRLGFRHGLSSAEAFEHSSLTQHELDEPYTTKDGIERCLAANGYSDRFMVIEVRDPEKGAGWIARPHDKLQANI